MDMSNIPEGYDENGVRCGNGVWQETQDEGIDIVECIRCGKPIDNEMAVKIPSYGTGYLCEKCVEEIEL